MSFSPSDRYRDGSVYLPIAMPRWHWKSCSGNLIELLRDGLCLDISVLPAMVVKFDGFVKSPEAALRCILRRCSVPKVRFTPQDLRALSANFLQSRPKTDFLRGHQVCS